MYNSKLLLLLLLKAVAIEKTYIKNYCSKVLHGSNQLYTQLHSLLAGYNYLYMQIHTVQWKNFEGVTVKIFKNCPAFLKIFFRNAIAMVMCSFKLQKMALLKYFKCIEPSKEKIESVLPKSDGPLALSVTSSTMARPLILTGHYYLQ